MYENRAILELMLLFGVLSHKKINFLRWRTTKWGILELGLIGAVARVSICSGSSSTLSCLTSRPCLNAGNALTCNKIETINSVRNGEIWDHTKNRKNVPSLAIYNILKIHMFQAYLSLLCYSILLIYARLSKFNCWRLVINTTNSTLEHYATKLHTLHRGRSHLCGAGNCPLPRSEYFEYSAKQKRTRS